MTCNLIEWLKADTPTSEEWVDIVYEIYIMEELFFHQIAKRCMLVCKTYNL